jgi:hypothetical protein
MEGKVAELFAFKKCYQGYNKVTNKQLYYENFRKITTLQKIKSNFL